MKSGKWEVRSEEWEVRSEEPDALKTLFAVRDELFKRFHDRIVKGGAYSPDPIL